MKKESIKKMDSNNYRKLLRVYYQELKASVGESHASDRVRGMSPLKRWDKILSVVLQFQSPRKESEFVDVVLAMERQNLRRAA